MQSSNQKHIENGINRDDHDRILIVDKPSIASPKDINDSDSLISKGSNLSTRETPTHNFFIVVSYVYSQTRRSPNSFCIAITSICAVVTFITLLTNILSQSGIVFFKLSELYAGEHDLV